MSATSGEKTSTSFGRGIAGLRGYTSSESDGSPWPIADGPFLVRGEGKLTVSTGNPNFRTRRLEWAQSRPRSAHPSVHLLACETVR